MRIRIVIGILVAAVLPALPASASATKTFAAPYSDAASFGVCDWGIFPFFVEVGDCAFTHRADASTGDVELTVDTTGNRSATVDGRISLERAYARSGASVTYTANLHIEELTRPDRGYVELWYSVHHDTCGCSAGTIVTLSQNSEDDFVNEDRSYSLTLQAPDGGTLPDGTISVHATIVAHGGSGGAGVADHMRIATTLTSLVETVTR